MREYFEEWNPNEESLALVSQIVNVLRDYRSAGYDLTVRQLYYQLVSRNLIPNNPASYNRIVRVVSRARRAGMIDWSMIVDRGRVARRPSYFTPSEVLEAAVSSMRLEKWNAQPHHVEVMVEKDALSGVLAPVCARWEIPFTANRGYSSDSALYRAAKRMAQAQEENNQEPVILYLGDHDASGLDMDRDLVERISMFGDFWPRAKLERVALTRDQVDQWNLPPNPAKLTDSRAREYIRDHGRESWELDAIEPQELERLTVEAIRSKMDLDLWYEHVEKEDETRERLQEFTDTWEAV